MTDLNDDKIVIFDTTLRDGEQASGFHLYPEEKLDIARQLTDLGVDVIEAGFPASSRGDFRSVYDVAQKYANPKGTKICALARCHERDIKAAAEALDPAHEDYKRIHVFIATSDIHMRDKLRKSPQEIRQMAVDGVSMARQYSSDVEFSCEDFGRSDRDYIVEMAQAAIDAGAGTINLPDTVGFMTPGECHDKVRYVIEALRRKGYHETIFSVHNHNDLGMATATSIEAVRAGVRQVECTINGIGERAGNAALEEIVAILGFKAMGTTGIDTRLIGPTSKLVSRYTGVAPQPNKSIVGANAFAHESGIHVHGQQANRAAYEVLDPDDYGVASVTTFGPRSGQNGLRRRYNDMGIYFGQDEQTKTEGPVIRYSEDRFLRAAERFKDIADKKKRIDDADLIMALENVDCIPVNYVMRNYAPEKRPVLYGMKVLLDSPEGEAWVEGIGDGLIDAGVTAISKVMPRSYQFQDFRSYSTEETASAPGLSWVHVVNNGWRALGRCENSDVVTSAISAYLDGCNRMHYIEGHFQRHAG